MTAARDMCAIRSLPQELQKDIGWPEAADTPDDRRQMH